MRSLIKNMMRLLLCALSLSWTFAGQEEIRELESRLKASPNDESVLMELGRLYHDLGVGGDEKAVARAFELFDHAVKLDSSNAVALAYRGSVWTLRARDSWWPPNKLSYLRNGGEDLDGAVSMEPGNIMVRMIRGVNGLGLPDFLADYRRHWRILSSSLSIPNFPNNERSSRWRCSTMQALPASGPMTSKKPANSSNRLLQYTPGQNSRRKRKWR